MIEDLVAALDRAWEVLSQKKGYEFAAHLLRFREVLRKDTRSRAILEELKEEEEESRRLVEKVDQEVKVELEKIIDMIERDYPELVSATNSSLIKESRQRLTGVISTADPSRMVINTVRALAKTNFDNVRSRIKDEIEGGATPNEPLHHAVAAAHAFCDRVDRIDAAYSHGRRSRQLDEVSSAGAALVRLDHELEQLHPPSTRLVRAREYDQTLCHIRNQLFERQPALMNERAPLSSVGRFAS